MKSKRRADVLRRVGTWPAEAQDEFAGIAGGIAVLLTEGDYVPSPAEIAGIACGLRDADAGRFASDDEVEAPLTKLRRAGSAIPAPGSR